MATALRVVSVNDQGHGLVDGEAYRTKGKLIPYRAGPHIGSSPAVNRGADPSAAASDAVNAAILAALTKLNSNMEAQSAALRDAGILPAPTPPPEPAAPPPPIFDAGDDTP